MQTRGGGEALQRERNWLVTRGLRDGIVRGMITSVVGRRLVEMDVG
jgi:hypothetical protein